MVQLKAEQTRSLNKPITSYSTIAQCLSVMDEQTKFEICYVMAKEGIPFMKYSALHQLENHDGVQSRFYKDFCHLYSKKPMQGISW